MARYAKTKGIRWRQGLLNAFHAKFLPYYRMRTLDPHKVKLLNMLAEVCKKPTHSISHRFCRRNKIKIVKWKNGEHPSSLPTT